MKNKIFLLVVAILFISFASASFDIVLLKYGNENVDYAVIENTYKIYLAGNMSGQLNISYSDALDLLEDNGDVRVYEWIPNQIAGIRNFTMNQDTFSFLVKSETQEMLDKLEGLTIFIGEDNSYIEIQSFDLEGTTQETQDINIEEYDLTYYNFNVAELLAGLNANFTFEEGGYSPLVNYLKINGTKSWVIDSILDHDGFDFRVVDINRDPQHYINYLIDFFNLTYEYPTTAHTVKNGNYYYTSVEEGYGSIDGDLENQIQEFIDRKLEYFNPLEIVDELFKLTDYDLLDYFNVSGFDYEFAIDFNDLELEDGDYTLSYLYEDAHGNTGKKDFIVILDISRQEKQIIKNNTYIPNDPKILEHIQEITGLPNGIELTAIIHGDKLPPNFVQPSSDIVGEIANYIEISLNESVDGEYVINFSTSDTFDENRIKAYVYESDKWQVLPTTFIKTESGNHYFYFEVTHFSKFMIAEEVVVKEEQKRGGRRRRSYDPPDDFPLIVSDEQEPVIPEDKPIDLTPDKPKDSGQNWLWIILLGLFVIVIILIVFTVTKKPNKRESDTHNN